MSPDTEPMIIFGSVGEFADWLDNHAGLGGGVWLKIAKIHTGIPSITSDEAVDVGLCYGWISAKRVACDDEYYLQRYVPRRPRSNWSSLNVTKVDYLTAAGRMRPGGIAEVEAAKRDGRWAKAMESEQ